MIPLQNIRENPAAEKAKVVIEAITGILFGVLIALPFLAIFALVAIVRGLTR